MLVTRHHLLAAAIVSAAAASAAQAQFIVSPYRLQGEPAPGTGANYANFDRPNISPTGAIVFHGDTDGATTSDDFIYIDNTLVMQEGQAAPDSGGGLFGTTTLFATGEHINASNDVLFINSLTGVPTTENVAIYSYTNSTGALKLEAREGQPAPGVAGRLFVSFDDAAIFDAGGVGFLADLDVSTTDDSIIYRNNVAIYREGSGAPFLPVGETFDATFADLAWNGAGAVIFEASTNAATNDAYLIRDVGGTGEIVAREGDPIAANGGPDFVELFLQAALADNGRWAYRGNLGVAPAESDAFLITEDGFYRQQGESVPELPGVVLGNFNDIDINSSGDVVWLADLTGAADPNIDEGLFLNDKLIITDGVQAPGLPAGVLLTDIHSLDTFINDAGTIVFAASYLVDGVTHDGIFTAVVPEPGTIGLAGAAALGLLLRRRRAA